MKPHTTHQAILLAIVLTILVAVWYSLHSVMADLPAPPLSCERMLAGSATAQDTVAALAVPPCASDSLSSHN